VQGKKVAERKKEITLCHIKFTVKEKKIIIMNDACRHDLRICRMSPAVAAVDADSGR
jgi:hypothetical protein